MVDIQKEVVRFNDEFAKIRSALSDALKLLQHEPEFAELSEMTKSLDANHRDFNQQIGPAIEYLKKEHADVTEDLRKTQAEIVELEQKLEQAKAVAAQVPPMPEPPSKPSLVPGQDTPVYGQILTEELLRLIGKHPKGEGAGRQHHGSVWELDSVDWTSEPTTKPQARKEPPKPTKSEEGPRDPSGDSIGLSDMGL